MKKKKDTLLQVLASIRELDPPLPSDRFTESGKQKMIAISSNRRLPPSKLRHFLRGDPDWIVMKALEKDRKRRYATADEFAEDIRSYLRGDAVIARPASPIYKAQKFVRRNRGLVFSAATIFALLTAATAVSGWFAWQADKERKQAEIAGAESNRLAERTEGVLSVITRSFEIADRATDAKFDMSAKDVLENARKILDDCELDELGKADLLDSLTTSFLGIGQIFEEIYMAIQKKHGPDHPQTKSALIDFVWSLVVAPSSLMPNEKSQQLLERLRPIVGQRQSGMGLVTLGLLEYRMGNYEQATANSLQSMKVLTAELGLPAPHPADLAVQAMSYHQLKDFEKSSACLKRLSEVIKISPFKDDAECLNFFHEANFVAGDGVESPAKKQVKGRANGP